MITGFIFSIFITSKTFLMQLLLQDIMQQRREQNVFKKSSHYPRYLKKKGKNGIENQRISVNALSPRNHVYANV